MSCCPPQLCVSQQVENKFSAIFRKVNLFILQLSTKVKLTRTHFMTYLCAAASHCHNCDQIIFLFFKFPNETIIIPTTLFSWSISFLCLLILMMEPVCWPGHLTSLLPSLTPHSAPASVRRRDLAQEVLHTPSQVTRRLVTWRVEWNKYINNHEKKYKY